VRGLTANRSAARYLFAMFPIVTRADMDESTRSRLEAELAPLAFLQDVVRWAFALTPPRDVAEVVTQDEYTHDVVIPWTDQLVLVFDCT
jgi:hypothetical protein